MQPTTPRSPRAAQDALEAMDAYQGFTGWADGSDKVCEAGRGACGGGGGWVGGGGFGGFGGIGGDTEHPEAQTLNPAIRRGPLCLFGATGTGLATYYSENCPDDASSDCNPEGRKSQCSGRADRFDQLSDGASVEPWPLFFRTSSCRPHCSHTNC